MTCHGRSSPGPCPSPRSSTATPLTCGPVSVHHPGRLGAQQPGLAGIHPQRVEHVLEVQPGGVHVQPDLAPGPAARPTSGQPRQVSSASRLPRAALSGRQGPSGGTSRATHAGPAVANSTPPRTTNWVLIADRICGSGSAARPRPCPRPPAPAGPDARHCAERTSPHSRPGRPDLAAACRFRPRVRDLPATPRTGPPTIIRQPLAAPASSTRRAPLTRARPRLHGIGRPGHRRPATSTAASSPAASQRDRTCHGEPRSAA